MLGSAQALGQQPRPDEFQALRQRIAAQDARLRQLEAARLPPVNGNVQFSNYANTTALERRVAELESMIGDKGLGKGEADSGKPTQKWFGRIHLDHWAFPGNDDGTNFFETNNPAEDISDRVLFRRTRIGVRGDIGYTMLYKLELDFATPQSPAIKDAHFGWRELPYLQTVLLGNQKRPYGLDTLNSSRYNVFMERPFAVEAFNQGARRVGVQSYGVSQDQRFNWRYGAFLSTDVQRTGIYLATSPGMHHYQPEIAGRLANTIWYDETSGGRGYAHWGVSGAWAFNDYTATNNTAVFKTRPEARTTMRWIDTGAIMNADDYGLLGFEGVINVGALQIVGEYQRVWVRRMGMSDLEFGGGYLFASYFLTGEHIPWSRKSGTIGRTKPFENFFLVDDCDGARGHGLGAWQIAARYSYGDFTDDNVYGGVGQSFTFGLNWWWTAYSRMQFNYIIGDIDDRDPTMPPNAANYQIIGSRFAVDF
jgi:phosphate-selective porin OprO/OprP